MPELPKNQLVVMGKKLSIIAFFWLSLFSSSQLLAAYYSYDNGSNIATAYPWVDISSSSSSPGTSVPLGDDEASGAINLGFTFNFSGSKYSSLKISSNGVLGFGSTLNTAYSNTSVASASNFPSALFPYWDDLDPSAGGQIRYKSFGSSPNRYLVVSFIGVRNYCYNCTGSANTFQIRIYESGKIVYRYGAVSSNDGSVTTGYYFKSSDYVQYSFGSSSALSNGLTVLWTPPAKLLAQYRMEETSWNGTSGEVKDSSGNTLNGTTSGSPLPSPATASPARTGSATTCGYAGMPGPNSGGGIMTMLNLPVDTSAAAKTSVSFWMYWNGANDSIPIGWNQYDLWFNSSSFGFNTDSADIYGISSTSLANGWHHVVAIFTNGSVTSNQLYIDGIRQTLSQQINSPQLSRAVTRSTLILGGYGASTSHRFSGRLDEVKVYDGALTASQVSALYNETHTCPTVAVVNHFRLEHSGNAATCSAGGITLKACADSNCNTLFTGSTTVTLSASAGSWSTNPVTFTGQTTVNLALTSAATVLIGTNPANPGAINNTRCFADNIETCNLTFSDSGFQYDVPNHRADTSQTVTITAVKKGTNSNDCTTAFANSTRALTLTCSYLNPTTGTKPVRVSGVPLNSSGNAASACDGSGRTVNVPFNANGMATGTVQYADAGLMQVNVRYNGSTATGDAGLVMTGTDTFIAAPSTFAFSNISATPIKAGSPFNATVSALNSNNAVTPNFGKEAIPESVKLEHQLVAPTGSNADSGTFTGSLGSFSNGSAGSTSLSWDEVGIIKLTATLTDGDYLGTGYTVTGSSNNIDAFVPHHFVTETVPACVDDNFTYSGQHFTVGVTAKNFAGVTTVNYDGSVNTAPNFAKVTTLSEGGSALGSFAPATLAVSDFLAGSASTNTAFTFSNAQTIPSTIAIRATDANASSSGFAEGTMKIFSGRLSLQNANGSELQDLPVPLHTEFWNGSSYELNSTDNCTSVTVPTASSGMTFGNPLNAGQSTASINGASAGDGEILLGDGQLLLSKPGMGNTGYVDITIDAPTWLEFNWQGAGNTDPKARATFGIYKGDPKQIYFREVY